MRNFFAVILLLFSMAANATLYFGTGSVLYLTTIESSQGTDKSWTAISGLTSAGSCPKTSEGYVITMLRDDTPGNRMYATILTALTDGNSLTLYVNDAEKNSGGYCYLQQIFQ